MKLKIASIIMGIAILILGVAIYKLHTKETPVIIENKREETLVKPPDIRPPLPKPKPPEPAPVISPRPLEIKQGHIIKR